MTDRRASPSGIDMRIMAFVALLLAGGCSWITARGSNDPRVGCSRTSGRIDAVIAVAGAVGVATAIALRVQDPAGEGDHGNKGITTSLQILGGLTVAVVELIQSNYGLRVADRCEAERAKLTSSEAP
jgi:hypothetical protein